MLYGVVAERGQGELLQIIVAFTIENAIAVGTDHDVPVIGMVKRGDRRLNRNSGCARNLLKIEIARCRWHYQYAFLIDADVKISPAIFNHAVDFAICQIERRILYFVVGNGIFGELYFADAIAFAANQQCTVPALYQALSTREFGGLRC